MAHGKSKTAQGHNIDHDFVEAMRSIGGKRPLEINPSCQSDLNADIVLPADNVIIEVKTLVENSTNSLELKAQKQRLFDGWVRDGKIPRPKGAGPVTISTRDLPEECAHELLRLVTKRPKRVVESANKQIKALKMRLKMPDANGLVVLCNSGNPNLPPDVILYGLDHAMRGTYSSVDWLLFMTHHLPVHIPGMQPAVDVFAQTTRDGHPKMPPDLFARIRNAWMSHVSKGTVVTEIEGAPDMLFDAKH